MLPRLLLTAALLAVYAASHWAPIVYAAVAFVREATCTGDDCTATFAAAPGASNHILVGVTYSNEAQTLDLTGTPSGVVETVLHGPEDHSGAAAIRQYLFCMAGDGADTTFVATTSSTAVANVVAIEVSGLSACTEDGTSQSGETSGVMTHTLGSNITTTVDGSVLIGIIMATNTADFVAGTDMTTIPADGSEIAAEVQGMFRITATAGGYGCPVGSTGNESAQLICAAVQPAGGGGGGATAPRLMLLGVGE